jgi:hypothetical protein
MRGRPWCGRRVAFFHRFKLHAAEPGAIRKNGRDARLRAGFGVCLDSFQPLRRVEAFLAAGLADGECVHVVMPADVRFADGLAHRAATSRIWKRAGVCRAAVNQRARDAYADAREQFVQIGSATGRDTPFEPDSIRDSTPWVCQGKPDQAARLALDDGSFRGQDGQFLARGDADDRVSIGPDDVQRVRAVAVEILCDVVHLPLFIERHNGVIPVDVRGVIAHEI